MYCPEVFLHCHEDGFHMELESSAIATRVRKYLVRGALLLIPVLIPFVVLGLALDFIRGLLRPVAGTIRVVLGLRSAVDSVVLEATTVAVLVGLMFLLGIIATHLPTRDIGDVFDAALESIPGIGGIYSSVKQLTQTIAGSGDTFEDVVLVEYPTRGVYSIAFVTAETPESVRTAVSEQEMRTLLLPMGPNPVIGGFTIYVPTDRVYDFDISVEAGLQAVATSGVTLGSAPEETSVVEEVRDLEPFDDTESS